MATSRRRIYPSHGPLIDEPCFRKPCFAAALFGLRRFVAQSAFSLRLPTDYGHTVPGAGQLGVSDNGAKTIELYRK
jgi:hypothetical protein